MAVIRWLVSRPARLGITWVEPMDTPAPEVRDTRLDINSAEAKVQRAGLEVRRRCEADRHEKARALRGPIRALSTCSESGR